MRGSIGRCDEFGDALKVAGADNLLEIATNDGLAGILHACSPGLKTLFDRNGPYTRQGPEQARSLRICIAQGQRNRMQKCESASTWEEPRSRRLPSMKAG